jgi:hypothetical protein
MTEPMESLKFMVKSLFVFNINDWTHGMGTSRRRTIYINYPIACSISYAMEDLVDLADDVDTYGDREEDVADDEDRAGVFQLVITTFGNSSNGLEKSGLVKNRDNYHVSIFKYSKNKLGGVLPQSEDLNNFYNFLIIHNV